MTKMQKLLTVLGLLLSLSVAHAQVISNPTNTGPAGAYNSAPPTCTAGKYCLLQTDANGNLKTVAAGTPSGTQDVNLKQIQGAAPSATNPLWVSPATASTPWTVTGSGTAGTAAAGVVTVQGIASMTPVLATETPSSAAGAANAFSSTSALASNLVLKASAGNLYSFEVAADSTLSAAAWWIMIYNATSLPGDGAVTPAKCYAVPAGTSNVSANFTVPVRFGTGITIGVSTNGCFTQAASIHAFISGEAQ